jgi:NADH-quinone oxidoreductase subunit J
VAVVMLVQMLSLIGVGRVRDAPLADNAAVDRRRRVEHRPGWHGAVHRLHAAVRVAAVILTVAVVAAVMLTLRRRTGTKHQDPSEQSRVKASDRVRMVKMPAESRCAAGGG